jgi:hypothetical protein
MPRRKQVFEADFTGAFANGFYPIDGFIDFFLAPRGFRHETGDGPPMARNDDGFPRSTSSSS